MIDDDLLDNCIKAFCWYIRVVFGLLVVALLGFAWESPESVMA